MYKVQNLKNLFIVNILIILLFLPAAFAENKQQENIITLPIQIPTGDKNPEKNTTNGIDDDNDGIIDEGSTSGTCMIIIYNTNRRPDDEWELIVDNKSEGVYRKAKARFWDLMLDKGHHEVTVKGVFDPDNSGNYSIEFINCKPLKGPPKNPFNNSEQETFTWIVEVP